MSYQFHTARRYAWIGQNICLFVIVLNVRPTILRGRYISCAGNSWCPTVSLAGRGLLYLLFLFSHTECSWSCSPDSFFSRAIICSILLVSCAERGRPVNSSFSWRLFVPLILIHTRRTASFIEIFSFRSHRVQPQSWQHTVQVQVGTGVAQPAVSMLVCSSHLVDFASGFFSAQAKVT